MYSFCKKMMVVLLSCVIATFFVSGFFNDALALNKPNLKIGSLEIHPLFYDKQTYDSNLFKEEKKHESWDFITDIGLGVGLEMPLIPEREKDFTLKGSYLMDLISFVRNTGHNRVDHKINTAVKCNFANGLGFRASDEFLKTAVPPSSERTSLDKRINNVLNTILSYERERITVEGGYTMTREEYNELGNLDLLDHMFTGTCFYQVLPKTSVLVEYDYGRINYDKNESNSNSYYSQVRGGVTGKLWPKLTGTVKAGYEYKHYFERNNQETDFSNLTLFGNLKYQATQRTVVNLNMDRSAPESSYTNNSYFEKNKFGLNLEHKLLKRLSLNGATFLQYNRYPAITTEDGDWARRKDLLWGLASGLTYNIREWIAVDAGYAFKQRDSRFNTFDYNDHQFTVKTTIEF